MPNPATVPRETVSFGLSGLDAIRAQPKAAVQTNVSRFPGMCNGISVHDILILIDFIIDLPLSINNSIGIEYNLLLVIIN
jgi:hypothetical protein